MNNDQICSLMSCIPSLNSLIISPYSLPLVAGAAWITNYYHRKQNEEYIKLENGGRPIPGYSFNEYGEKICDEYIKELIIQLIETEAFGYGYYKLTILLKRRFKLIVDDKKLYRAMQGNGYLKTSDT